MEQCKSVQLHNTILLFDIQETGAIIHLCWCLIGLS